MGCVSMIISMKIEIKSIVGFWAILSLAACSKLIELAPDLSLRGLETAARLA